MRRLLETSLTGKLPKIWRLCPVPSTADKEPVGVFSSKNGFRNLSACQWARLVDGTVVPVQGYQDYPAITSADIRSRYWLDDLAWLSAGYSWETSVTHTQVNVLFPVGYIQGVDLTRLWSSLSFCTLQRNVCTTNLRFVWYTLRTWRKKYQWLLGRYYKGRDVDPPPASSQRMAVPPSLRSTAGWGEGSIILLHGFPREVLGYRCVNTEELVKKKRKAQLDAAASELQHKREVMH